LSGVDWNLHGTSKLELVSFDWDNLNERHSLYEFFWSLIVKAVSFTVPSSTFNVKTLDISTVGQSLSDFFSI
jgi:hypothetical protein